MIKGVSLPPIGVDIIVKVIKTLIGIFKKPSEEAGKTDSSNSLENVERIIQIFSGFKEQVHSRTIEIERAVESEVAYYVEELQGILSESSEKVTKYGIQPKRIERQIEKISTRTKGIIDNELSKKVSLDNAECKEIIKMIPGTKKEKAMEEFLKGTVSNALEACCAELHSSINEIYEDVEAEVIGTVEAIQKQVEILQESFAAIDETNYEETVKKQMRGAYYLSDVCDLVFGLM